MNQQNSFRFVFVFAWCEPALKKQNGLDQGLEFYTFRFTKSITEVLLIKSVVYICDTNKEWLLMAKYGIYKQWCGIPSWKPKLNYINILHHTDLRINSHSAKAVWK